MPGKSTDPKQTRITVRLSDGDLKMLHSEARRRGLSVGATVRDLIRRTVLAAPRTLKR